MLPCAPGFQKPGHCLVLRSPTASLDNQPPSISDSELNGFEREPSLPSKREPMFFITSNKSKQLLYFSFIGRVEVEELARGMADLTSQLAELEPGFRVLGDLERLESMCVGGSAHIGKAMELCDQKGVGLVVRVIPDRTKDIGFGI